MVREDQEGRGDHHGHLSHGRPSQRGRGGSGCGQQWCELQGGSVTSGVSRAVVCVCLNLRQEVNEQDWQNGGFAGCLS